jgi:hypothetical protein
MDLNPKLHRLLITSNDDTDSDCDPDNSSLLLLDIDGAHGSPEQHSLSGLHGQRRGFGLQ